MVDCPHKAFPEADRAARPGYGSTSKVMLGKSMAILCTGSRPDLIRRDFLSLLDRPSTKTMARKKDGKRNHSATHPEDSGASGCGKLRQQRKRRKPTTVKFGRPRPLAVSGAGQISNSSNFVLADLLESRFAPVWKLDVVQDWTWPNRYVGSSRTFLKASRVAGSVSTNASKLAKLMTRNALIVGHDDQTILTSDFKGQGSDAFVPLADVPDFSGSTVRKAFRGVTRSEPFCRHGSQAAR